MIRNYTLIAFRNIVKQGSFSLLNILGLSIGITSASLIFLWVEDEITFSDYFKKKDHLYQVYENQSYESETFTFAALPGPFAPAIEKEIPGLKHAVRTTWGSHNLFTKDEKSFYADGLEVEPPFFTMFNFDFIHGDPNQSLKDNYSIVVSDRLARKIFNQLDVVGKYIKLDNKQEYKIDGVFKALPENCRFQKLDYYLPFQNWLNSNNWALTDWGSNSMQTFVEVHPEADVNQINNNLKEFITNKSAESIAKPFLLSAHDWRLRSEFKEGKQTGGRMRFVKLFSLIAWIILLLACINFMNLATARSDRRTKEVGVRKVLGSAKSSLISQYLTESILMSGIAVLISIGLTCLTLPVFNKLVEKQIQLNLFSPGHIFPLLALGLLCGCIAGTYPAFYLSSFRPIEVLKGLKLPNTFGAASLRKGLVITQFIVSVALIICTMIIYQQIQHTKNRDLGINKSHLINFNRNLITFSQQGDFALRLSTIKNELLSTGLIENIALSNSQAFQIGSSSAGFNWKGKEENKDILISMQWCTPDYIATMGMKLLSGRDFYATNHSDTNSIIINETFAKLIKHKPEDAIGQQIDRENQKFTIVGVTKDFIFNNIYGASSPVIMFYDGYGTNTYTVNIRFKQDANTKAALAKTEQIVKENNPAYPFEFTFVDEKFEELFKGESLIGKLAGIFAGLAIFVSCLGLFGLAAYSAQRRTKEISIRKVLGANTLSLTSLLSKDFLILVFISCLIAFPIAYLIMNNWLKQYEYRVSISWWMFTFPACVALLIALITVCTQAVKAAVSNPIQAIRTE